MKNYISMTDLAKLTGLQRGMLYFYRSMGLLSPDVSIGSILGFEETKAVKAVNKIKEETQKGKTLIEIKAEYENRSRKHSVS